MTQLIHSGEEQKLFKVEVSQHQYNNYGEMGSYQPIEYLVRTTEESTIAPEVEDIAWDCDTGIIVYGKTADIEKLFAKITKFLSNTLDEEEDLDLPDEGTPSRYCLFKSPTQDLSIILAHGSYVDLDEDFVEILEKSKKTFWHLVNNDLHPIEVLQELVEGEEIDNNDKFAKKIIKEINIYKEQFDNDEEVDYTNKIKLR